MPSTTSLPSRSPQILVIDDEEIIHSTLRKILSHYNYQLTSAFAAQEGLALLQQQPFDLIITDLMMPQLNGMGLLRALQARGSRVPVIMITGYPTVRTAIEALRLGASDYVAKPFTRKELVGPVQRALQRPEEDHSPDRPPSENIATASTLVPDAVVYLPFHAWCRYEQEGTFLVGIEQTFLQAVGPATSISCPEVGTIIDQGHIGIMLVNGKGVEHGVVMPLSGEVLAVQHEALKLPERLTADVWLLRVLPVHLDTELQTLVRRS